MLVIGAKNGVVTLNFDFLTKFWAFFRSFLPFLVTLLVTFLWLICLFVCVSAPTQSNYVNANSMRRLYVVRVLVIWIIRTQQAEDGIPSFPSSSFIKKLHFVLRSHYFRCLDFFIRKIFFRFFFLKLLLLMD